MKTNQNSLDITSIAATTGRNYSTETVEILTCICDEHKHTVNTESPDEIIGALDTIEDNSNDFTLEFNGNEYRVICDDCIWEIYRDEIQQIVENNYLISLEIIPDFVALKIDWEETAENAYEDGYGHTFSSYDGSEHEAGNHWVFRTN